MLAKKDVNYDGVKDGVFVINMQFEIWCKESMNGRESEKHSDKIKKKNYPNFLWSNDTAHKTFEVLVDWTLTFL